MVVVWGFACFCCLNFVSIGSITDQCTALGPVLPTTLDVVWYCPDLMQVYIGYEG